MANDINNKKAVIFDLDGVLVDTGEFHKRAWYDLAEKEGVAFSDELFYSTFGMQNYQIIPKLIARELYAEEIQILGDWKEQRYRKHISGKLELLKGVETLIEDLKSNGFLLAIGSSTPRDNLAFMLEHIPIKDFFDAFVAAEDVSNGKPAPDTFLKAAEKLSLPPQHCVVVEDAVQGVEAGKAAGMTVVAVTTTKKREDLQQADIIVDTLEELTASDFIELLNLGAA